jgi:hypothetical protein
MIGGEALACHGIIRGKDFRLVLRCKRIPLQGGTTRPRWRVNMMTITKVSPDEFSKDVDRYISEANTLHIA